MNKEIQTLCIIHDNNKVLLGMKKHGFGEGRWNGFGGKVKDGESIEDAVVRETEEEACIKVGNLKKQGIIEFSFKKNDDVLQVHIFSTTNYTGKPAETEEMLPKWFDYNKIPYEDMWSDDKYWLPKLLEGKCFKGSFLFGGKNDVLLEYKLNFIKCKNS